MLIAFLLCATANLNAQTFTPFSQYGLGNQSNPVFSANRGMGSISAGYRNSRTINFQNPASYTAIEYTVFEMGALADIRVLSDSTRVNGTTNGGVNHLAMAFPIIQNKWGMSFGLLPYSNVNYNFSKSLSFNGLNYDAVNKGQGSTYKFYIGNAVEFGKFSFGLNAAALFGNLDYTTETIFTDTSGIYNSVKHNNMTLRDVTFNLGVQYHTRISSLANDDKDKQPIFMTIGAYGAPPVRIDAFVSSYTEASVTSILDGGTQIPIDTAIGGVYDQYNNVTTPGYFGTGVSFGNEATWLAGIDFHYDNWKNFKSPLGAQNLVNDWKLKIGGQLTPKFDGKRISQRMEYRFGAHFGKTRMILDNTALPDFGMSFGIGIPFAKSSIQNRALSKLNLTFEAGRQGTANTTVLQENYYKITLGYTLSDRWFIKRKFD